MFAKINYFMAEKNNNNKKIEIQNKREYILERRKNKWK